MRVAFFYPGFESLGIEMLSAALKQAGHETALFYEPQLFDDFFLRSPRLARLLDQGEWLVDRCLRWRPDLVGFSVVTHNLGWAQRVAPRLKRKTDVPIVFGGIHPTLLPDRVLENECVDYVVRGEGEVPLVDLLAALANGGDPDGVRNLCFRRRGEVVLNPMRPLFEGLDRLPPPDKSIYRDAGLHFRIGYLTLVGRGCPNRCSYCFHNYQKKLYPKTSTFVFRRPPEDVLDELEAARSGGRLGFVMFVDENFCADPGWAHRFLDGYRARIREPFWCLVHPSTVDREMVRALAASGCAEVQMGVETVSPAIKKKVLFRDETPEQIARAIDLFREHRIRVTTDNIVNVPGHTPDDLLGLARFYLDHTPDRVNSYWLLCFPKLDVTRIALERGLIEARSIEALERGEADTAFFGGSSFDRDLAVYPFLFFLIGFAKPLARLIVERGWIRRLPFLGFRSMTALLYGISLLRGLGRPRNTVLQKRTVLRYLICLPAALVRRLPRGLPRFSPRSGA